MQTPIAQAAVEPRRLGLHPVEQRQAQLTGSAQVTGGFRFARFADVAEPVVVLRPVDKADVRWISTVLEVFAVGDASDIRAALLIPISAAWCFALLLFEWQSRAKK